MHPLNKTVGADKLNKMGEGIRVEAILSRALRGLLVVRLRLGIIGAPAAAVAGFYLLALLSVTVPNVLPPPPGPGILLLGVVGVTLAAATLPALLAVRSRRGRMKWIEQGCGLPYQPLRTLDGLPQDAAEHHAGFGPAASFQVAARAFALEQLSRIDLTLLFRRETALNRRLRPRLLLVPLVFLIAFALWPARHVEWLTMALPDGLARLLPRGTYRLLQIEEAHVRIHPPSYTHWPPTDAPLKDPALRVLKGTRIQLAASTNQILRSASLASTTGARIHAEPSDRHLESTFDVLFPHSLRIEALNRQGEKLVSKPILDLSLAEDGVPQVVLLHPAADMGVDDTARIQLQYSAEDDFGLRRFELVIWRGSEETVLPLERLEGESQSASGSYILDLVQLKPRPGELIGLQVRAWDNDTISGPKAGVSETRFLEILSADHRHKEHLDQLRVVWDNLIEALGLALPTAEPGPTAADRVSVHHTIDARVQDTIRYLGDALGRLANDPDIPSEWFQIFSVMRQDLESNNRRKREFLTRQADALGAGGRDPHPLFLRVVEPEILELEEDVLLLDRFFDLDALSTAYQGFQDALERQGSLTDILKQLDLKDSSAVARVEDKLRDLEAALGDLYRKLMETARQVPDEVLNREAMQSLETSDMSSLMGQIRDALGRGDMETAQRLLAELRDQLQKLMSTLDAAQKGGRQLSDADFARAREMYESIDRIEKEQVALREETFGSARQSGSRAGEDLRPWVRGKLEQIRKRLEEAEQRLSRLELSGQESQWTSSMRRAVENALANESEMRSQLDRVHLPELLPIARSLELASKGAEQTARDPRAPGAEFHPGLAEAAENATDLVEALRRVEAEQQNAPTGGGHPLEKLAGKQNRLAGETSELARRIQSFSEGTPFLGGSPSEKLDQAGEHMQGAEEALGQGSGKEAIVQEDQAIQKLREAKGGLQQALNGMSFGMSGLSMPFPSAWPWGQRPSDRDGRYGAPTQKVQIPTPDQHKVPKEFREDILEAMKEKYPERFEQPIRKYYEELLK